MMHIMGQSSLSLNCLDRYDKNISKSKLVINLLLNIIIPGTLQKCRLQRYDARIPLVDLNSDIYSIETCISWIMWDPSYYNINSVSFITSATNSGRSTIVAEAAF